MELAFILWMTSILTASVDSRLLRLNCHSSADFKVIKEGEVLQGSVISTFDHLSFQECKAQCLFDENCKSINFQNEDDQICELNSESVPEVSVFCKTIFKRKGWTHASTSYISQLTGSICNISYPCKEDEICFDTCQCPGYKCIHFNEAEKAPICIPEYINIARGKKTAQSSEKYAGSSARAVDGNRIERHYHGSCTHTIRGRSPNWWMVYFGRTGLVFRVYITGHQHYTYYPKLDIRVGNTYRYNANPFCKQGIANNVPGTRNFTCDAPMKGKYLFIVSSLKTVLTLCEVEVIGFYI